MRLPYGNANFAEIRRGGYFFADKTGFIPELENAERGRQYLIFLRPRRMGKTLIISMLEHYYDVLSAPDFDALFGGLAVHSAPTGEQGRYVVLRLEMTGMPTDQGSGALREAFFARLHNAIETLFERYGALLSKAADMFEKGRSMDNPASLMDRFLQAMRQSPRPLYLLIDEYDNFTNDLIARGDHATYREILHASGFVREFYKTVKEGAALGTIRRIFMTGVSPVTLDDLTSGFNIASNISLLEEFNTFAGFTTGDVRHVQSGVVGAGYTLDPARVEDDLRLYYNGYLFSQGATERVYNPDMVLYFFKELRPPARYPHDLIDINLRTDYGRIQRVLSAPDEAPRDDVIEQLMAIIVTGSTSSRLQTSFPLDLCYEGSYFISLLYYMGLLTLQDDGGWARLGIPNYAVRTLYWEAIAKLIQAHHAVKPPITQLDEAVERMAREGDLAPFLTVVHTRVLQKLSNRDLIRLDEKTMKVLLLAYLSLSEMFFAWSEVELSFGYGDLVLLPRRSVPVAETGFLLELKYLKAGSSAEQVQRKLDEADEQLRRYLADPKIDAIKPAKGFRAASIVFVATEACWLRVLGGEARRVGEGA